MLAHLMMYFGSYNANNMEPDQTALLGASDLNTECLLYDKKYY